MDTATDEEKQRNCFGRVYMFGHMSDSSLKEYVEQAQEAFESQKGQIKMDGTYCGHYGQLEGFEMGGVQRNIPSPGGEVSFDAIPKSHGMSAIWTPPALIKHDCKMLEGAEPPKSIISAHELADQKARKGFGGDQARKLVYTHLGHLFGKASQRDRFNDTSSKRAERDQRVNEKRQERINKEQGAAQSTKKRQRYH